MGAFKSNTTGKSIAAGTSTGRVAIPVGPGYTLRVVTDGTGDFVYLKFGDSTVVATTADDGYHYKIPTAMVETIGYPLNLEAATHVACITGSTTVNVSITSGEGV